jgi:hypothetical protein
MGRDDIRVGMTVRDAAGTTLGKVRRVYPWGFEARRGLFSPYQWVIRRDEITGVDDGVVAVARRQDDLLRLAAGGLPESWRRYTPPMGGPPLPAAPAEARAVEAVLAGARPAPGEERADFHDLDEDDEREYVRTRGQGGSDAHAHA